MSKHPRSRHKSLQRGQPGAAPGSLIIDPHAPPPAIQVIAYGPDVLIERDVARPEDVRHYLNRYPVCWINVDGLGDAQVLEELGAIFELHPLALEDVVNVHQRAKVDHFGEQLFIVTHMIAMENQHLETEQISLFLAPGVLLTFQERPGGDCLGPVRERLRNRLSRIRENGADYLAYSLLDAVIDHYFPVLEVYGEKLEDLEDRIVKAADPAVVAEAHDVKRELLLLRRTIWPQREAINVLVRDPIPMIQGDTRLHFRDCYDHAVRIIDLVETYREVCSDLMDLYLSSASNRMNEIMKVLTIMSTIFIPLTFIAGVYGMNFKHMPELDVWWAYPLTLILMAAVAVGLLFYFRHKGWIWKRRP